MMKATSPNSRVARGAMDDALEKPGIAGVGDRVKGCLVPTMALQIGLVFSKSEHSHSFEEKLQTP